MQGLWNQKLDFKNLLTTYYMSYSDNRARNDDHLKFAVISNIQSRTTGPRFGRVKHATGQRWSCAFYATILWFDRAFYGTIPRSNRARLDVINPCKF